MTTIAVLGTGSIGTRHLNDLLGLSGPAAVKVIAVPLRQGRRDELRQQGRTVADSLEEAAQLGATRCIVATDTGRHAADVLAAMALGMDVLVEKPMATTGAEAAAMRDDARARGRQLYVGCVLRFSSSLKALDAQRFRLGRVHTVQIVCQSYLPDWRPQRAYHATYSARPDEGGVLRDLIHEVDYASWLFGWPTALQARLQNLHRLGIDAEEIAELQWLTPAGASVTITLDYLTTPPRRHLAACGEHGTLVWDGVAHTVTLAAQGAPVSLDVTPQTRDDMLTEQTRAFLRACDGTRDARLATAEDGVKALAVCDAAREASGSRRETAITYP